MLKFALAQLHRCLHRYLVFFGVITLAVAVAVGIAAVAYSLGDSVRELYADAYAGSDAVITLSATDEEAAEALVTEIRQTPGVADVVFDQRGEIFILEAGSRYTSTTIQSLSPGPQQVREELAGRLPRNPDEVATTDQSRDLGSTLALRTSDRAGAETLTVVGHFSSLPGDAATDGGVLLGHPQQVAAWFPERATGEIRAASTAGVTAEQVSERLEAALIQTEGTRGTVNITRDRVRELNDRHLQERRSYPIVLAVLLTSLVMIAAPVLTAAALVIAAQRRREYALLRAIGAGSGQLSNSVLVEAALVSVGATLVGIPLGYLLGFWLAANAAAFGISVPVTTLSLDPAALVVIGAAAVAVSIAATLPSARWVAQGSESATHRGSGDYRQVVVTLLALFAGVVLAVAGWYTADSLPTADTWPGLALGLAAAVLLVSGIALGVAALIPWGCALLARLPELPGGYLKLGLATAGQHRLRSATLVAVMLIGTAMVSFLGSNQDRFGAVVTAAAMPENKVDVTLNGVGESLGPALIAELTDLDGIAAVAAPGEVSIASSQGRNDTALALSAGDAEAVGRTPTLEAPAAGSGQLVLGQDSPLRSELVDGSVTTVQVLGHPFELAVSFGANPRSLIDEQVAEAAKHRVAQERAVPVELAPDLPTPVVLLRLDDPVDTRDSSATMAILHHLLEQQGHQVAVRAEPDGWDRARELGERVSGSAAGFATLGMLLTWLGLAHVVALSVRDRSQARDPLHRLGLTPGARHGMLGLELSLLGLIPAVIGAAAGMLLSEQLAALVPDSPGLAADATPMWGPLVIALVAGLGAIGVGLATKLVAGRGA